MKNRVKILTLSAVIFSLAFLASCGNDKEVKPANRITVNGTSYDFSNAYLLKKSGTRNNVSGYGHSIFLTGTGLTVQNGRYDGQGNIAYFVVYSKDAELPEGTYLLLGADADFGDASEFQLVTSFNGETYGEAFTANYGKIIVAKSGSIYTFTIEFDRYVKGTSSSDQVGEGNIKGYYSGSLEPFSTSTAARGDNKLFPFTF